MMMMMMTMTVMTANIIESLLENVDDHVVCTVLQAEHCAAVKSEVMSIGLTVDIISSTRCSE